MSGLFSRRATESNGLMNFSYNKPPNWCEWGQKKHNTSDSLTTVDIKDFY